MYELALINYHRYHSPQDDKGVYLSVKPFFIKSVDGEKLARFFLPHERECMTLRENDEGTINPLWFNLIAEKGSRYDSKVCISPKRTVTGGIFTWYYDLPCNWWLGFNMAVMQVKHDLHLKEHRKEVHGTLPGFKNACDAFNNPEWKAGKLACREHKKTGVDDVQLKLGYDFYKTPDEHATLYLVGTAPTGTERTARFLFEPVIGSRNGSVGVGFNGDYAFCANDGYAFNVMTDVKYRYVFSATERRSFDLKKNGDWSRYLLITDRDETLDPRPGINFFTLPVHVTPRSTVDVWLAAHYQCCCFNLEVGYDFWWRQSEHIDRIPFKNNKFGLQSLNSCTLPVTTSSTAKIDQGVDGENATKNDEEFVKIQRNDLNRRTAEHPNSLSHKVYGALGYTIDCECYSVLLGFGSSYEFAARHAFNQWSVWGTYALAF